MSSYLHQDVIDLHILPKLPAKSLIRFKTVCKSWNSYISSPEFSQEYSNYQSQKITTNTINDNICIRPIFRKYSKIDCKELFFVLCPDHYETNGSQSVQFMELKHPVNVKYNATYLRPVGSCDGLTCFSAGGAQTPLVLWNPSMQESSIISTYGEDETCNLIYGFGFDYLIDDYKVVLIAYEPIRNSRGFVDVYSVKARSWNQIYDYKYYYGEPFLPFNVVEINWRSQTLMNGRKVHWLANCEDGNGETLQKILSFDMRDEMFDQIPLPGSLAEMMAGGDKHVELTLLPALDHENGITLLTVLSFDKQLSTRGDYCVWIMEEYGVVDSWTNFIISFGEAAQPLGFLSESRFLFRHFNGELVSFDYRTQRKEYLGASMFHFIGNYRENLFKFNKSPIRYFKKGLCQ